MEFRLPDLGEGIDSATVTAVMVKPGDAVAAGQNVIAVETDKASVEVPADAAGTVEKVHVKSGDKLSSGAVILTLKAGSEMASQPAEKAKEAQSLAATRTPRSGARETSEDSPPQPSAKPTGPDKQKDSGEQPPE